MADPLYNQAKSPQHWLAPGLAVILDMDGVIVDSNPIHRHAWEIYNRRFGMETGETMHQRMYGKRNDEIVRDFYGDHLSDEEVFAHGAAKERLFREMMAPYLESALVPGLRELLRQCQATPTAVASNAEPANIDFVLDSAGLRSFFDAVVDGQQVARPKPYPDVFLRAAELLKTPAANCIVFEDSFSGVKAARAAGMRSVGVRTTHAFIPGVDLEIDDFLEPRLRQWLSKQKPV